MLKTPITYYGGKQQLIKEILLLMPQPQMPCYCEPFFGGGAVFFALKRAKCETINDNNNQVINFYKVFQDPVKRLKLFKLVNDSLLSREQHRQARDIYRSKKKYSDIKRAWAFWMLSASSFNGDFYGNVKFSRSPVRSYKWIQNSKINLFSSEIIKRLECTQIECNDALKVIDWMDSKDCLFYVDPPYMDCDQGHYYGYGKKDFNNLLTSLSKIKGKFLLSCYVGDLIYEFIKKYNWNHKLIMKKSSASAVHGKKSNKIEMLVYNYEIENKLF